MLYKAVRRRSTRLRNLAAGLLVTVGVALVAPAPAAALGPHDDCGSLEFGCKINEWIWQESGLEGLSQAAIDKPGKPEHSGTVPLVRWLVSMPQYGDSKAEPKVLDKLSVTTAIGLGLVPLMLLIQGLRSWIAGFTGANSASAIIAPARAAIAVGAIASFSVLFNELQNLTDAISIGLVASSDDSFSKLLALLNPPSVSSNPLWFLLIVGFFIFVVMFMKVVLGTMLGIFFLLGPIGIALWILDETAWVARGTLQGAFGVLLFGPVAGVVFLLWGVVEPASFDTGVPFLVGMGSGFFALGSVYMLYKIPVTVVKQAGFGAATPSPSRMLMVLALTRFIARGGAGTTRARAPQPAPGPTPSTQYTSPSGRTTTASMPGREGVRTWSTSGGPGSGGFQLSAPSGGRHWRRRDREPNIERTDGDPARGGGRHAATKQSVERDGLRFNEPATAQGSGRVTTEESRRFNELPAGSGSASGDPLVWHGAGMHLGTLSGDATMPTRDYYRPTAEAKNLGFGNVVRETYAGGTVRWAAPYTNPLTGQKTTISGPEMGYVLHGRRT